METDNKSDPYQYVADKHGIKRNDVKAVSFSLFYNRLNPINTYDEAIEACEFACELAGLIGNDDG